jgi:hypothetical protein
MSDPDFNLIVKNEETGSWEKKGAAWVRDDGKSYNIRIGGFGEEQKKYLMVENRYKNTKPSSPDSARKSFEETKNKKREQPSLDDQIPF